jgi:hypothetical protein
MNLEKFVEESLVQIANGIQAAQAKLKGTGAIVNPRNVRGNPSEKIYGSIEDRRDSTRPKFVQSVSFDVVVSANEESTAEGGGGLQVGFLSLGGKAGSGDSSGSESRLTFQIPMVLPFSDET